MSAKRIKKFRVHLVVNRRNEKHWQELRDENRVMNYHARFLHNADYAGWHLYSKLGTLKGETEHGDFIRSFSSLEKLCNFLGVNNPT